MKTTTKIYFGDKETVVLALALPVIPRVGEGFSLREKPHFGTCTVREVGHEVSILPSTCSQTILIYLDPE